MKNIILGLVIGAGLLTPAVFMVAHASDAPHFGSCDGYVDCVDPCDTTWCYPSSDSSDYGYGNTNGNENVNNNTNINNNEIYINIYGNGSVTGTGIDARSLPSCNNALDDDEDGRVDFNDSDCLVSGRENGRNASLNMGAPTFVSTAPTSAVVGETYSYDADARDVDADTLSYSLIQNPSGMTIERSTGAIRWVPGTSAAGVAHAVTVVVSDGSRQAMQSFQIFVEGAPVSAVQPSRNETTGRVAGVSAVATAEASERSTLRAFNIRVDTDELGNSVVTWDTTRPTRGRVLYGLASQGDRQNADFTGAGQYEFVTANTAEMATSHRVVLGQLETDRAYYFRVVSFAGTDSIVSSERSFVQLGDGKTFGLETGFASAIGSFGQLIMSPWFLFFAIVIIVLILVFRRKGGEIEAHGHGPVEMHVGGGHH